MTDQQRMNQINVWEVRKACLEHAMAASAQNGSAEAVVAYATVLETYVLRAISLNTVTEPAS